MTDDDTPACMGGCGWLVQQEAWEWGGGWVSKRPLVDLAWKDEVRRTDHHTHDCWLTTTTTARATTAADDDDDDDCCVCVCCVAHQVMGILESFTERTPGSFLEVKDSCLAWHYRDADPDFGLSQAKNLHQHLDQVGGGHTRGREGGACMLMVVVVLVWQMLKHQAVRVITCPTKKYMVIHPSRYRHPPTASSCCSSGGLTDRLTGVLND